MRLTDIKRNKYKNNVVPSGARDSCSRASHPFETPFRFAMLQLCYRCPLIIDLISCQRYINSVTRGGIPW